MSNPVIIIGTGTLAKAALEVYRSNKVEVFGFLTDKHQGEEELIGEIPVLGDTENEEYFGVIGKSCDAFLALDEVDVHKHFVTHLKEKCKVMPNNAFHGSSVLSEYAIVGHGIFLGAKAIVNAFAEIKNHCILNSAVVVEADAVIGEYVQIGAGSVINAGVIIEEEAFIGSNVTIVSGVKIGKGARVGAGSVVIADVDAGKTVFGNPAKEM